MPLQRVTEGMRTKGHGRTLVFTEDERTCYPHETSSTLTQVVTQDARTGYPHETSSISFIHQRPSIKHHLSHSSINGHPLNIIDQVSPAIRMTILAGVFTFLHNHVKILETS